MTLQKVRGTEGGEHVRHVPHVPYANGQCRKIESGLSIKKNRHDVDVFNL